MNEKLIQELREGKCALYVTKNGDERIEEVFKKALPDNPNNLGGYPVNFYYVVNGDIEWSTSTSLPKYNIEDFLEEEWKPKRGETVLVGYKSIKDKWLNRIFLCEIEGAKYPFVCVSKATEKEFEDGEEFSTYSFNQIKRLEKPETIEITIEEIAKMKGVKPDQIRIKE